MFSAILLEVNRDCLLSAFEVEVGVRCKVLKVKAPVGVNYRFESLMDLNVEQFVDTVKALMRNCHGSWSLPRVVSCKKPK